MLQDIAPHRLWNQYHPEQKADSQSAVVVFRDKQILVKTSRDAQDRVTISYPLLSELPWAGEERLIYLFTVDKQSFFLSDAQEEGPVPEGYEYRSVRELRDAKAASRHLIFAAYTALQLAGWYRDNRYCGRCGGRTKLDEKERAIRCPACGNLVYPRIVPAVIVAVKDHDRLLVTKYASGFAHYALVAGFTEIGETLEETVEREVMEEVGLKVRNIRYYKSQPWGIVDDILAGFYCDVDGSTEIHMDQTELKVAEWKERQDIVLQPDDFSLTNEMMTEFKEGRQ